MLSIVYSSSADAGIQAAAVQIISSRQQTRIHVFFMFGLPSFHTKGHESLHSHQPLQHYLLPVSWHSYDSGAHFVYSCKPGRHAPCIIILKNHLKGNVRTVHDLQPGEKQKTGRRDFHTKEPDGRKHFISGCFRANKRTLTSYQYQRPQTVYKPPVFLRKQGVCVL